jgi:uncharacterized protein YdeI (YjbR/CyaY-like superfamily)
MEALCYGWVDSVNKTLDEERAMQRFTPRRKNSNWTAINKGRVARLIAEGRMMPAGQAEIDRAKADGRWTLFDAVQALELPGDLVAAFDASPPARANYDTFAPSAKQAILGWIATAKSAETRAKRVQIAAEMAQRNLRAQIDKPTDPPRPVKTK